MGSLFAPDPPEGLVGQRYYGIWSLTEFKNLPLGRFSIDFPTKKGPEGGSRILSGTVGILMRDSEGEWQESYAGLESPNISPMAGVDTHLRSLYT